MQIYKIIVIYILVYLFFRVYKGMYRINSHMKCTYNSFDTTLPS